MRAPNIARSRRRFRKRLVLIPLALAMGVFIFFLEHNNPKSTLIPAWLKSSPAPVVPAAGPLQQGEVVSTGKALIGGHFQLTDTAGNPVTEQNLVGDQFHLLFFGFTNCPDVCPAMLQMVADTLQKLPEDTAAQIRPVFITVDPARDDAATLQSYVEQFDPRIHAWRGSDEQLKAMAKNYLVYYAKRPYEDTRTSEQSEPHEPRASHLEPDYTMDHSAYLYLFGPDGSFIQHFPNTTSQETLIQNLIQHTK